MAADIKISEEQELLSKKLIAAASLGDLYSCMEFVKKGALVDYGGRQSTQVSINGLDKGTALMAAAGNGYLHVCRYLCDNGANVNLVDLHGWSALVYAARKGHEEVVKFLVEEAKIKQTKWAISNAGIAGHYEVCEYLFENTEVSKKEIDGLKENQNYHKLYHYLKALDWKYTYKKRYESEHRQVEKLKRENELLRDQVDRIKY